MYVYSYSLCSTGLSPFVLYSNVKKMKKLKLTNKTILQLRNFREVPWVVMIESFHCMLLIWEFGERLKLGLLHTVFIFCSHLFIKYWYIS